MNGLEDIFSKGKWRIILISVALFLTFSIGMIGGSNRREKSSFRKWSRPGIGYDLDYDGLASPSNATTREDFSCDKCCYRYTTIEKGILKTRNKSELKARGCKKRLPDAMIFGVKKGGTTTLKNFLSYHPGIAFTQKELKFFTSSEDRGRGVKFYKSEMLYSTPDQVSMEKTPAYSHYPKVPAMIKRVLPDIKLIIIMRDPVQRAISDFVHMQVTIAKKCKGMPECMDNSDYNIADTFEDSVLDKNGEVNYSNLLVSKGVYVTDIQRYLKYFQPEQILALDGEAFIKNPYPAVKLVEQFLGIRDYFKPDHFYYDPQKRFFCLNKPIPKNCMKKAKGRPHPEVNVETLKKLRDYYRPYNKALNELMDVHFHWSS